MSGKPVLSVESYHDSTYLGNYNKALEADAFTGDWQQLTTEFMPYATANKIIVYLMVNDGTGKVYFDDITLVVNTNLLQNPKFESDTEGVPDSWGVGCSSCGVTSAVQRSGAKSGYIENTIGAGTYPNLSQTLATADTTKYELSAWVKVEDVNMTGKPVLSVESYHDSTYLGNYGKALEAGDFTGDWQLLATEFTPYDTANKIIVYLMVNDGTGKVYFDDVTLNALSEEPELGELGSYQIWTAPNTTNLLKTAPPLPNSEIRLDMAKREYQSGQAIVTARDGRVEVTSVNISDLTSGAATIPAANIDILVQHYVYTSFNTTDSFQSGWYPDALIPYEAYMNLHGKVHISRDENQAFWFTVRTNPDTPAGIYDGTIRMTVNGTENTVPIQVKVRNFALPEENHAQTAFTIWKGDFMEQGHPDITANSPAYWELMRNYYEFLLNYHITATDLPIPTDNYEQFVVDAAPYVNDPRVSAYRIPYVNTDFDDGKAKALVENLETAGLLDKAYYYLGNDIDEPTPAMFPKVVEFSQKIMAINPNVRHIVTTDIRPELSSDVNTFAPLFDRFLQEDFLAAAKSHQEAGGHIWWYGCVYPRNPYPAYHIDDNVISARLLSWMQKAYGIEGNLYWATNIYYKYDGVHYVPRDIWNDPLAFPGANGDGFLLYPGTKYGINGPIATLRLQTIRDGNQDYEYLWLLEQQIRQASQHLGVDVTIDDIMKPYYERLFQNVKTYTLDVNELQNVRSEVADMIEQLQQDPTTLIRLDSQKEAAAYKKVTVYTEKGAEVFINGEEIVGKPIANNAVADEYTANVAALVGMNEVSVTIIKDGYQQDIKRYFYQKSRILDPIMKKVAIHQFDNEQSLANIIAEQGAIVQGLSQAHAPAGGKSLQVKIPGSPTTSYPAITIPLRAELKDITEFKAIAFNFYNDSDAEKELHVEFIDNEGNRKSQQLGTYAHGDHAVSAALAEFPGINGSDVASIRIWTVAAPDDATFYFSDLHFLIIDEKQMELRKINYSPIVPDVSGPGNEPVWKLNKSLEHITGTTDNKVKYDLLYNSTSLFAAFDVIDEDVVNTNAVHPWDDDSIELYIDGKGVNGPYTENTVRYVFRYNDETIHAYGPGNVGTNGIKHQFVRTGTGYKLMASIPWQLIGIAPAPNDIMSINIHVNDKDVEEPAAAAQGKLSLINDISQDAISSVHWAYRVFEKPVTTFAIEQIAADNISIDGKTDESFWRLNYNIGHMIYEKPDNLKKPNNTAKLDLKWSEHELYAAFEVRKDRVNASQTRPVWEEDSVELFIDGDFLQGVRTGDHAPQYTFRFGDDTVYYNGSANASRTQGITHKSIRTNEGYLIEISIPWDTIGVVPESGKWIGITAHVNNNDDPDYSVMGLTENGMMDGLSTAGYLAFQLKKVVPVTSVTVVGAGGSRAIDVKGGTLQMEAVIEPANAGPKPILWAVYGEDGMSATAIAEISESGMLKAKKNGKVTVEATVNDGSRMSGRTLVTISGQEDAPNPGTNPAAPGTSNATTDQTIAWADIKPNQSNSAVVEMKETYEQAILPSETISKMIDHQIELVLQKGDLSVTLPAGWLKTLMEREKVAAGDAVLRITIKPVAAEESDRITESAGQNIGADISLVGNIWEISLNLYSDGVDRAINLLPQPLKLSIPIGEKIDRRYAGLFNLSANGEIEYVGGAVVGDRMEAHVTHLSLYALLEINKKFNDLPTDHWATEAIKQLAARQVVNGISSERFAPERQVTRAEFTALLARALNIPESDEVPFTDVKAEDWYAGVVAGAAQAGLIKGIEAHKFAPQDVITREQMAVLLVRAHEWLVHEKSMSQATARFADEANISRWAKAAVDAASQSGLMKGRSSSKFAPNEKVTRAESAKAVHNLLVLTNLLQ